MKQVETTREAMINRRSVRKYKTDMIPRDIIERIVEAGTYAANISTPWPCTPRKTN